MLLINNLQERQEMLLPLRNTERTTSWLRCFHASVCIIVVTLFLLRLFDSIVKFGTCRTVSYGFCDAEHCCASGSSCTNINDSSVCVPNCPTGLWEACNNGNCCPDNSVCTPRTAQFSQCVPALPKFALIHLFHS